MWLFFDLALLVDFFIFLDFFIFFEGYFAGSLSIFLSFCEFYFRFFIA